ADGDLDLEYRWSDRAAGIEGADVDVRAVTLHKVHPEGGAALGSLLGSATIRRGGALHGNIVVESLPLSRVTHLGPYARDVDGSASGLVTVAGQVDDFRADANIDVGAARVRGQTVGPSHLHWTMTQRPGKDAPIGTTPRCHGRIFPAFSKEAYLKDD